MTVPYEALGASPDQPATAELQTGPSGADPAVSGALRCRCVWRGERCANQATEEDGLCNWCGNKRTEHQLRKDPAAHIGPDGTYFGLSGRGQTHDYDVNKPASTAACWYPDADRVVLDV